MIVIDASTVIEILLRTALGLRCEDRVFSGNEDLCAPHLIDVEVLHALRRYSMTGDLPEARGAEALADFEDFPLMRYPHTPLLRRIWDLRSSITAYDAAYVALAEAVDGILVTCDAHLGRSHGHQAIVETIDETGGD